MKSPQRADYVWQQPGWPNWKYDHQTVSDALINARQLQAIVIAKAQAVGFTSNYLVPIINQIWIDEIMATAAIEGQQLNLDLVRSSVMRKFGARDVAHTSRHVDGLVDVIFDATEHFNKKLDIDRLCRWQSALFPGGTSGIKRIEVGKFRTFLEPMQIIGGKIGKEKVYFQAPDSSVVPKEMVQFINWFNTSDKLDGIVRAAIAHVWFETIHPFEDGNGRIGRAIIDLVLAQEAQQPLRLYSMSGQLQANRAEYYQFLNEAQKGDLDITSWIKWFITQFSAACQQSILQIDKAVEKARFWATHAEKSFNDRQRKTLQKLLDAGDGGFLGGLTADKYCKITGTSKATATRDLTDLLQQGALIISGQGKATKYYVNVVGWNKTILTENSKP
jgi:Fic family protein